MSRKLWAMSLRLRQIARAAAVYAPQPIVKFARYPREWLFVNGYAYFSKPTASVVFFSTHKCASTLMLRMLVHINKRTLGLTHLNLAAFLWDVRGNSGLSVQALIAASAQEYFRDRGVLYAPLRSYVDISHLRVARPVLMLRDPRDILVSGYYSAKYSHRPPADSKRRAAFLKHREDLHGISVEDYALIYAPHTLSLYDEYRRHIPRSALLTYEQMWHDFPSFAARLAQILGVKFSNRLYEELRRMAAPDSTDGEDITAHRRKGTPGDFRDKLSPQAAARLTELFADNLKWMYGPAALEQ